MKKRRATGIRYRHHVVVKNEIKWKKETRRYCVAFWSYLKMRKCPRKLKSDRSDASDFRRTLVRCWKGVNVFMSARCISNFMCTIVSKEITVSKYFRQLEGLFCDNPGISSCSPRLMGDSWPCLACSSRKPKTDAIRVVTWQSWSLLSVILCYWNTSPHQGLYPRTTWCGVCTGINYINPVDQLQTLVPGTPSTNRAKPVSLVPPRLHPKSSPLPSHLPWLHSAQMS